MREKCCIAFFVRVVVHHCIIYDILNNCGSGFKGYADDICSLRIGTFLETGCQTREQLLGSLCLDSYIGLM